MYEIVEIRLQRFFYHEEEARTNAIHMCEEILDIEDDNACVRISNFIPF
jgi:hypothetical protein